MSKAIIDIDSYLYKASYCCSTLVEIQQDIYYEAYDINKARVYLKETAEELSSKCGCDEYIFVTGGVGENFRKIINPNYKLNRKKQSKPLMFDKVKELVFNEFPVCYIPHLEADDTCRILLEENKDNVIISIDKDLRTFEGKIYDSYHDNIRFITKQQAEANFKRQLLMGDKVDGFSGLKGVGPATANKLLLEGITVDDIAQMYIDKGLGIETFEMVYNMAHILGREDFDEGIITLYGGKKLDVRNK